MTASLFMRVCPHSWIGSSRTRFPVAAKIALVIAGATGANGPSPSPLGESLLVNEVDVDVRNVVSSEQNSVVVKIAFLHDAVLDGDLPVQCGRQTIDDDLLQPG